MAEVTGLRNNALPYPVYGAPYGVAFPILDADGDLVTGAAGLDSEVSKNGDTFADCTNEATEIATSSGVYYLLLTATEMTADVVTVIVKTSTSGAKTTTLVLYPRKLVELASGTAQGGDTGYITLAASTVLFDGQYAGCLCVATIDGSIEARILQVPTASNQQATVTPAWNTAPDSDDTYKIYLPEGVRYPTANVKAVSDDSTASDTLELFAEALKQDTGQLDDGTFAAGAISAAAIADDAITAAKFDESTAYPLKSADTGATAIARTGADSDTLETLSDQIDGVSGGGGDSKEDIYTYFTSDDREDVFKASGFSTLTAQQVWEYATRVLTANTNLGLPASWPASWPANWSWSTHSAADVVTALGTGATLTACVTATGFSTHSAADVVTAMQVVAADFKADVSGLATSAEIAALESHGDATWATATGFSTHAPADVLTAFGDGSTLTACATATGFSTHSAADVVSAMQLVADDFKADVSLLATSAEITALAAYGDLGWSTATGFSTHSASDVVTAMQAVASDFKTDVSGLSTLDADDVAGAILAAPANKLATDASGYVTAENMRGTDSAYTGTPPTVEAIAGQVRTELGTELGRIDATISSRGTSTLAAGAAMTLTSAYDAAKTAATQTSVDAIDTLLDSMAPVIIGTVTGAGTGTEVFVHAGVTVTSTVDDDGNRSSVVIA